MFAGMFAEDGTIVSETGARRQESRDGDPAKRIDSYLSAHFGGRQEMIQMYGLLQDKVFAHSPVEDVIVGTDGYLFYGDTVGDYCGTGILTGRELFNIARTLELMQEAVESQGARFAFTVAPNKNSLYDYMPYNYVKYRGQSNLELLAGRFQNVNYIDLFPVFRERQDVLYYKTDTHWNDRGAYYAFDRVLRVLGKEHEDYEKLDHTEAYTHTGDLERMLYPLAKNNELQIIYDKPASFRTLTNTRSFEQTYIETENDMASGSLVMFRDSFANNLIPYFSDAYKYAVYDKAVPYDLTEMNVYDADTVIVEIAERNIKLIQEYQPVFAAPVRESISGEPVKDLTEKLDVEEYEGWQRITGVVNASYMSEDSRIFVRTDGVEREMTPQKIGDSAYGFCGYVDVALSPDAAVIVETNGEVWEETA